ncbi:hypothetical protein IH980_05365 [Patescibacteria group bacterium]|nr:hypothetical protein [Patescibacteria group bacterium]
MAGRNYNDHMEGEPQNKGEFPTESVPPARSEPGQPPTTANQPNSEKVGKWKYLLLIVLGIVFLLFAGAMYYRGSQKMAPILKPKPLPSEAKPTPTPTLIPSSFSCPDVEIIDCMPGGIDPETAEYCTAEYSTWIQDNCPEVGIAY